MGLGLRPPPPGGAGSCSEEPGSPGHLPRGTREAGVGAPARGGRSRALSWRCTHPSQASSSNGQAWASNLPALEAGASWSVAPELRVEGSAAGPTRGGPPSDKLPRLPRPEPSLPPNPPQRPMRTLSTLQINPPSKSQHTCQ